MKVLAAIFSDYKKLPVLEGKEAEKNRVEKLGIKVRTPTNHLNP